MDSRFKRNQKIKLLEKFRRIITLGRKEAFLIRTENSDSINKKTNIFKTPSKLTNRQKQKTATLFQNRVLNT